MSFLPIVAKNKDIGSPSSIRAAAAQMVFAARLSKEFITPEQVTELEAWTGKGVLDALAKVEVRGAVSSLRFNT
jgi:uridine phosphorylase